MTYTTTVDSRTYTIEAQSPAEAALVAIARRGLPDHADSATVTVDGVDVIAVRDDDDGTWRVPGGDLGHAARAAEQALSTAAAALGRRGGVTRTPAKSAAARANGARGGRPGAGSALPVAIFRDGDPSRARITGRRSATAAGARLAAKRDGHSPLRAGVAATLARDSGPVDVWLVEVA